MAFMYKVILITATVACVVCTDNPWITAMRKIRSQESPCEIAFDKGPCNKYTSRFYYNSRAKRCDLFIYGGCEGNANNFKKYNECKDVCVNKKKSPEVSDENNGNNGNAGGSDDNGNTAGNNNTENTGRSRNVCQLPKDTGDCRGSFKKYYFNSESKSCQQFIYGGCFGNGNNFETLNECEQTCVSY